MECCESILQRICDELSEDIDSELCLELRRHLDECEECRTQLESMRTLVHLFRCLREKEVPEAAHQRLLTLLNVEEI